MLTAEQKEMRRSGIGASEIAAVCGLSPWQTPLEVWMRKTTPSRAPLIENEPASPAAEVGRALHNALRALYTVRTGIALVEATTMRHPDYPFVLATPGALSCDGTRGLEIKCVGARMLGDWDNGGSGVPAYVELQCRQNMAVTGRRSWDVGALLGGTEFRIFTVPRDLELEELLLQSAVEFWSAYIEGDTAPPEPDPDKRRLYLNAFYRGQNGKTCAAPTDPQQFATLCHGLAQVNDELKSLDRQKKMLENALCTMVGDGYGLESEAGKFLWMKQPGGIAYKAVAQELFGGNVPDYIAQKHRAADKRVVRFYAGTTSFNDE